MTKLREIYRRIKPYYLVVHLATGQAAVYDRKYQKMFDDASSQLINFAMNHHTQVQKGFGLTLPEQQPTWMKPGMEAECIGYHVYSDASSTRYIGEIPEG